ncbi:NAD(P)-dependent oxidoreductase [Streptomyces sp. NPDC001276]|uniref:NAD(P)-dependent oxidoreductase n=1 Tax=Streptomyces sp. NPDC001276 TaxID=3364555 RepID=UPI0036C281E3
MHVILYGASGQIGRPVLDELRSRGHQVTAVVRNPDKLPENIERVRDDLSSADRIAATITGADAVVSAYAPPRDDTDQLPRATERLITAVRRTGVPRLIVVGGCGSLEFSPGVTVLDSGHWPQELVPIAESHVKALDALRASDINWTYFSPPMEIEPGVRTGVFRLGGDSLIKDVQGNSRVSTQDYAVALVDELERPAHERSRFTIGY